MKQTFQPFARYAVIGVIISLLEIVAFYYLIHYTQMHYLAATFYTYVIGGAVQYFITRRIVFAHTDRSWRFGLTIFVSSSLIGAVLVALGMYLLVEYSHFHRLDSRILAGVLVGVANYLINLHTTFGIKSIQCED